MPNPQLARPVPAALPRQLALSACEPLLDAERLDAYRVALDFQQLVGELLPHRGQSSLRDQLERASASTVLNLAEGAGRSAPRDKAHFYAVSRGSAMECAAVLDVLAARGFASPLACRRGRALLVRVAGQPITIRDIVTFEANVAGGVRSESGEKARPSRTRRASPTGDRQGTFGVALPSAEHRKARPEGIGAFTGTSGARRAWRLIECCRRAPRAATARRAHRTGRRAG